MKNIQVCSWVLAVIAILFTSSANKTTPITLTRSLDKISVVKAISNSKLDERSFLSNNSSPNKSLILENSDVYTLHLGFPINLDSWIEKAPVSIADINNDGSNELVLPTYSGTNLPGKIFAWNSSGVLLPGFPITSDGQIRGRLAFGDLDHDGKLEIVGAVDSLNKGIGTRIFIWRSDGSIYPGWPQRTACYRMDEYCDIASIVLADINNDSSLEVIAGTDNRDITNADPALYVPNLYVWRSNGQPVAGNWPIDDDHNTAILGAMAVGDLKGDGKVDIVTGRDYNRLFAYDSKGNYLTGWPVYVFWPYDNQNWEDDRIEFTRSAVTLADLDNNGTLETIVNGLRSYANTSTDYNTDLLVYGSNGKRWPGWELPASGVGLLSQTTWRTLQAPAIGDLNGDNRPDIVVSMEDGWVRAYTSDKQLLWSFNYAQGKVVYATETVIGDVDGDGWNEVLFGTFDIDNNTAGPFGVWILDHNGLPKTGTPLIVDAPGVTAAPTLGDIDQDGKLEIAAVTWYGKLYVWDAPGNLVPALLPWPMARHDLQRTSLYVNPVPDLSHSVKIANAYSADLGDTITYTIQLIRTGSSFSNTIQVSDVVPPGLSYISGSLTATEGSTDDSLAPILKWTGTLSVLNKVSINYSVKVTQSSLAAITNSAAIDAGSAGQFTRSMTIIVNGHHQYLPIITR